MPDYPSWAFFPQSAAPPAWTFDLAAAFRARRSKLDTAQGHNKSNVVLKELAAGLGALGFRVETGGRGGANDRPVFFGEQGRPTLSYKVDAYHPELRVGIEVEAGRSIQGNNVYKDLVEAFLVVDLDYLVIAVPRRYVFGANATEQDPYQKTMGIVGSLYVSSRFQNPLRGIMVIGF